jgi:hypothetical protein
MNPILIAEVNEETTANNEVMIKKSADEKESCGKEEKIRKFSI